MLEKIFGKDFEIASVFNENIVNNFFIGICILDPSKIIKFWNKGAETITGYKMNEVLGQNFFKKIKLFNIENEDLVAFQLPITSSLEKPVFLDERLYMLTPKDEKVCLRLQAIHILNRKNEVYGEIIILVKDTDYFVQKKLSEELKILDEKKNELLGMASHDLRNPLGVIKGFTSILLKLERDSIKQEHIAMLELVDKNCNQMLSILNDLVDFSAIEDGKIKLNKQLTDIYELIDVNKYYAGILATKKNIGFNINIQKNIPKVNLDKERMMQVIENLLNNAVKFSFPETTITLSVIIDNKNLKIYIKDQGKGIPEEDLNLIFQPFTKAGRPTGKETSTGLGLAIVKKIVVLHQGYINVNSKPDEGTEFIINLPIE